MKTRLRAVIRLCSLIACIGICACISLAWYVRTRFLTFTAPQDIASLNSVGVVMILGAGLQENGEPLPLLQDRLIAGVRIYRAGKAKMILLTGDNGRFHQNEISAMHKFLLDQGISERSILVDGEGYRTYESCRRAKDVFGITEAILVTQQFHLVRARYLCERLGIHTQGVAADLRPYGFAHVVWTIRDWLASVKAWLDIHIRPLFIRAS